MRGFICCLLIVCIATPAYAWSECGHHIIAVMAYRQLKPEQQAEVIRLIKAHPKFEQDFKVPEGII